MKIIDNEKIKILSSEDFNFIFNKVTGVLHRWGKTLQDDPQFCGYGPEILDLEISVGDCAGGCPWCYKSNSTDSGTHMTLQTFSRIINKMPKTLTQVALGLTDISANPDLVPILEYSRAMGIIPNFTLAGYGLTDELVGKCSKLVGAVAVSVYPHNIDLAYKTARRFLEAGVEQTNFHLLYYKENLDFVKQILREYLLNISPRVNAIVLLALKPKGRAEEGYTPLGQEEFNELAKYCLDNNIPLGFDSCSAPKFEQYAADSHQEHLIKFSEPCESTLMSSYINVHGDFYPCSFTEGEEGWKEGISVLGSDDFIKDVWFNERTVEFREKLLGNCRNCPVFEI